MYSYCRPTWTRAVIRASTTRVCVGKTPLQPYGWGWEVVTCINNRKKPDIRLRYKKNYSWSSINTGNWVVFQFIKCNKFKFVNFLWHLFIITWFIWKFWRIFLRTSTLKRIKFDTPALRKMLFISVKKIRLSLFEIFAANWWRG